MSEGRPSVISPSVLRGLDWLTLQLRRIIRTAAFLAGLLVLGMTLFMTFDVLMRYGLGRATAVADDLTAYMLVGITFLGAASTELAGKHINVETFVGLLRPRPRNVLKLVTLLVALGYVVFLTVQALIYVATSWKMLYLSSGLIRFPLWMPQTFIPVGLVLLALALLANIVETAVDLLESPHGRA